MKAKNRTKISEIFKASSTESVRGETVQIGIRIPISKMGKIKDICRKEGFMSPAGYLMSLLNNDLRRRDG